MKKILVATTALVAAGLFSTGAQAADKVKLELGGFSKWFVVGAWNDTAYGKATGQSFNNVDVKGQSDINFTGSTKLDNGLEVGVFTAMRAGTDTGVGGGNEKNLIDRAYLYVSSGYGKVIMGVLQNGTHLLHVQAPESIGQWNNDGLLTGNFILKRPNGSGTIAGTAGQAIANGSALGVLGINGNGIMSTSILPGDATGKQEGITYVAPSFYGLTLGASYVPNSNKNVRGPVNNGSSIYDVYGIGANYTNTFDSVGVKASFGWARGTIGSLWGSTPYGGGTNFVSASGQEVNFFNAGLNVSYAGFTLGGSFRWNNHDVKKGGIGAVTTGGVGYSLNGHAWDAGLMYATGPWAASISYFGSRVDGISRTSAGKKEEVTFVQASAKYDLGPGVALQGLVGYGDYKASTQGNVARSDAAKNKGWTALTGVSVQF